MITMAKEAKKGNKSILLIVGLIIALGIGFFIGHIDNSGNSASPHPTTTITQATTVPSTTTMLNSTSANGIMQLNSTLENNTVVKVLYSRKTVHLAAPSYNLYYNYVIGCYWIDGYYNFSFYAPYPGYIVFNETNTGIPSNHSVDYFFAYFSTQKPYYYEAQPYNETSFCPGEIFTSDIEPWTQISPFDNQTMVVPVKNGTNYVLFYNGNANQKHGVNPFAINVTFSMTYYGFKGTGIPTPPNTTTLPPNSISWGKYGGG
jgi:hypothetical protein